VLNTSALLGLAKARNGDCSDYRIAQLLGLAPQVVSRYKRGVTRPENVVAARLGQLAGVDPGAAVAAINAERAATPEERELWLSIAGRLDSRPAPFDFDPTGH
jgi:transcriptional regulator with XRE-family HTH domain